jgi:vacuolar-type H+-ATPase subunit H
MLSEELARVLEAEQEAVARVRKAQADAAALIFSAEEEGRQLVLEAQVRAAGDVARYRESEVARAKDEADNTIRAAEREAESLKSAQRARVDTASALIVSAVTGERDVLPG